MIKTILDGEEFKSYNNLNECKTDIIKFFEFVTSYKEQNTTDFKKFIDDVKNIGNINEFNKKDYSIKLVEV